MKKGIVTLLAGLSVCTLYMMAVAAEEADCPHPFNDRVIYKRQVNDRDDNMHYIGEATGYECTRCGAIMIQNMPCEPHQWEVDWSTRLEHGSGLVSYDRHCTVCGYENSLYVEE